MVTTLELLRVGGDFLGFSQSLCQVAKEKRPHQLKVNHQRVPDKMEHSDAENDVVHLTELIIATVTLCFQRSLRRQSVSVANQALSERIR